MKKHKAALKQTFKYSLLSFILMKKKGQMNLATNQVVSALFLIVIVGAVALALSGFRDGLTVGGTAYNATDNGLTMVGNVTTQFGTVGTLIGVGILIAVVFVFFRVTGRI